MAFELKEGEGFLNRDNENPEKFWKVLGII
jgi:hypothetical protein